MYPARHGLKLLLRPWLGADLRVPSDLLWWFDMKIGAQWWDSTCGSFNKSLFLAGTYGHTRSQRHCSEEMTGLVTLVKGGSDGEANETGTEEVNHESEALGLASFPHLLCTSEGIKGVTSTTINYLASTPFSWPVRRSRLGPQMLVNAQDLSLFWVFQLLPK